MYSNQTAKGAIVATLGPVSDNEDTLRKMIEAGLDVVRLNLSHGTHDDHKKRFELIRSVDDNIPILLDLSGPKIRIGNLEESVILKQGDQYTLTREKITGDGDRASVLYENFIDEAQVGNNLFLNDGLLEFLITDKTENELICEIITGGVLSSRKGINAPNIPINLFAPTEKDINDISQTIDLEPDFYSVSFVRRIEDLERVRDEIGSFTKEKVPLISKIEHQDAIKNIDEIIKHSDGIMVARGDLGVELPLEDIPAIQKDLVEKCNYHSRPCIVATQMLESMVSSPRPTRAEVSDVASAIIQGTDAVMLSAETATGKYPVASVDVMNRIILTAQREIHHKSQMKFDKITPVAESIARAAVSLAQGRGADNILAFTRSGITSGLVSRFRPEQWIISVTPNPKTARRSRLQWGVIPLLINRDFINTDAMIYEGIQTAYDKKVISKDSKLVIVAGSLIGLPFSTNLVQYILASDILSSEFAKKQLAEAYNLDVNEPNY